MTDTDEQPEYGGNAGTSISDAPDGLYRVRVFDGDEYRAEKTDGKWYWSDGTGWRAAVEFPEEIVAAIDISALPSIKATTHKICPLVNGACIKARCMFWKASERHKVRGWFKPVDLNVWPGCRLLRWTTG